MGKYSFFVNGEEISTDENVSLLRFLRDELHLTSVKDGCSEGACGTCTVVIDGIATKGCVITTKLAQGKQILTVEGLGEEEKEAFVYAFGAVGAVQCGFCIPGMVMSGAALLRANPNPTEDDVKVAIKGNVCRCTGYKKIIEGILLAAQILRGERQIDPELERGDDYGVGKRAFRVDVRRKVLGYGVYPDDLNETDYPDMAYASAVRSKYPRARVLSIDSSKAEALPGVLGVLTAKDVPVNQVGHLIQDWDVMIAEGDVTRFVGDAICLVVAEDEKTLAKAKRLVKVTYEELEPVRNIEEAKAEGAPIIHDSFLAFGNVVELHDNVCQSRHVTRGNAKEALAKSAHVTKTFETPFTEHAFLEPECAVAFPYKDGVKVQSTDQGAYDTRKEVAHMFGWDETPERVVVQTMLVGGGFGGKEDVSAQHLAALAADPFLLDRDRHGLGLMGVGQRVARLGVAGHRGLVALRDRSLLDGVGDVLAGLLHEQAGPGVGPVIGLGELDGVSQGPAVRVELGLDRGGADPVLIAVVVPCLLDRNVDCGRSDLVDKRLRHAFGRERKVGVDNRLVVSRKIPRWRSGLFNDVAIAQKA